MKTEFSKIATAFEEATQKVQEARKLLLGLSGVGGSYIVFEDGADVGFEGMIQLSNKFETLEDAKKYADSWKDKNTYIAELVE